MQTKYINKSDYQAYEQQGSYAKVQVILHERETLYYVGIAMVKDSREDIENFIVTEVFPYFRYIFIDGHYTDVDENGNYVNTISGADAKTLLFIDGIVKQFCEDYKKAIYNAKVRIGELELITSILSNVYDTMFPDLSISINDGLLYVNEKPVEVEVEDNNYDSSKLYHKNEYCMYNGMYYKFIMDLGIGIIPTDKKYWEKVSVTEELNRLQNEINNLKN